MKRKTFPVLVAATSLLIGCGGGGDTTFRLTEDASKIATDTQDMLDRFDTQSDTFSGNVPTSGEATFTGTLAGVALLPSGVGDPSTFLGNVDVTTNFANSTLSGTAENFVGTSGGLDPELVRYSGTLAISNGSFSAADRGDLGAQVAGTLTGGDTTFAIDGALAGKFLGNQAESIRMATSTTGVIRNNGTAVYGGIELVAER